MQLTANNTNDLQWSIYNRFKRSSFRMDSRNGPVLRLPGVTTITLIRPEQRVNFCPIRDANPFFHLIEAIAMLAGDIGNDVELMSYFASNMASFSDDGRKYNAFYGTRARQTWGDQLDLVIKDLQKNPQSRQAVLNLWDPSDLERPTKDKACNLMMIFDICPEECCLNMTSFNRSNDAVWGGVTGANVVHLSMFQEYVAGMLNLGVGYWHHSSANLHVYAENPTWIKLSEVPDQTQFIPAYPTWMDLFDGVKDRTGMDSWLKMFVSDLKYVVLRNAGLSGSNPAGLLWKSPGYGDSNFLNNVVVPMACAYIARKSGMKQVAYKYLQKVQAEDWRLAGLFWMSRRDKRPISLTLDFVETPEMYQL